jgi:5'-AMP-activated protein kinase regulatory beta subunit
VGGIPGALSAPQLQGGGALAPGAPALDAAGGSFIPTVFRWEHGGAAVYITGAFNNWSNRVPMHRSGNDFVYIASLPRGKHAYKFIVDDEWRFAPDQPTVPDGAGNINNLIDLTAFRPDDDTAPLPGGLSRKDSIPGAPYGHGVPDEDEFTKEPPLLPPQLRAIVLNAGSPDPWDPGQLPPPSHVTLNHLYW